MLAMRGHHSSNTENSPNLPTRSDWRVVAQLWPYLWAYKWRVSFALLALVLAKVAVVCVPIVLKHLVDGLSGLSPSNVQIAVFVPLALVLAYGALRFATSFFTELREFLFVRVTQSTMRTLARSTFVRLISCRCAFI